MAASRGLAAGSRPLRALGLIKGLGRGGAELLLQAQALGHGLDEVDFQVAYLSPHKDALVGELEAAGVRVTCLRARSSSDPSWVGRFRRLVLAEEIDVVHAHSPVAAAGARLALRTISPRRRPRMVTTEHNMWQTHVRATRWADAATVALDDAHLAVSSAVRDSLPRRLRGRTEVVRHGIDVAGVARLRLERSSARLELGLDGLRVVGTVANLRATKGWPDLLVAARQVLDEVDDACFVAVGQGPMEDEIRALHRDLDLGDRFRLLGFRPDAVRLMSGCDLFCLASHHEGLPVAVMEAMALGLPIVATDVGGLRELVTDRVHGRLVAPHQPAALADALVGLLTDDRGRAEMAAAVLEASAGLSADGSIRRLEAVYADLVAR